MTKNIVLCSDGTGNQDIKNRGTNVFKLYEAVDIQGHKAPVAAGQTPLTPQVAFYDDGVGTANAFARVIGGAFGWGFSHNVKKLYRELANVYEPGDRIYLFGFSRGAYTVRALAGFIQHCGVLNIGYYAVQPRGVLNQKIHDCWEEFTGVAFKYSSAKERRSRIPSPAEASQARSRSVQRRIANHAVAPTEPVDIAFIGVWDTVGAIGTPFDGLRELIARFHPIWFADNTLGPEVARARHALALDEERRTFHPELWNEKDGEEPRVKQVWFAGVHSNVGGGYPKQGMSLVTLDWMMHEARQAGLRFINQDLEFTRLHQDVHDKLYDSRAGLGVYYRWSPRDLMELCREHRIRRPKLHLSLFERIANGTFAANGTDSYSPGNLPFDFETDYSGSIGSWPDPAKVGPIAALLAGNYTGSNQAMLEDMRDTVLSGKRSYYAFLALSLLSLVALITMLILSWCTRGTGACGCWLGSAGAVIAVFLVGSSIIHHWADHVDTALCKHYSGFWHRCRSHLRKMLAVP
ncbi:hypothetical protein GMST_02600 [Geomonas silvestris]|uniref:T6SS Phospholipase effector Tle1-like catalytic domain-containing protein n=1 Tax=Geomonas silvestris TaxID=2740184 RepID=A0A6V8MD69_9BACT|nr:DUF2235 domain-containing protein [Geomonas silvestris]GFO57935.1 hypothetical protein GMST_02600 [Geomonas silvestris]